MINIQVNAPDKSFAGQATIDVKERQGGREGQSHLIFTLAEQTYAVNLTSIREVRKMPPLTRVAHAPDYIVGVGSIRGEIVPVVDLRKRFSLSPADSVHGASATPFNDQLILITEIDGKRAAVTVDSISEVVVIADTQTSPIPRTAMAIDLKYLQGMVQHEGRVLLLVNLQKILEPEELHATANAIAA
jgi:purine-binding chemotaxis protein CheW